MPGSSRQVYISWTSLSHQDKKKCYTGTLNEPVALLTWEPCRSPLMKTPLPCWCLHSNFSCIVKWRAFLNIHAFKRRVGWGGIDVVYNECAHAHVSVCTNASWCLEESDTSVSVAFQEIMEPTRSFLRSSPDQPPTPHGHCYWLHYH